MQIRCGSCHEINDTKNYRELTECFCAYCDALIFKSDGQALEEMDCPLCGASIDNSELVCCICMKCGLVYHEECWQYNNGCSAYGCSENSLSSTPELETTRGEEVITPNEFAPQEEKDNKVKFRIRAFEFLIGAALLYFGGGAVLLHSFSNTKEKIGDLKFVLPLFVFSVIAFSIMESSSYWKGILEKILLKIEVVEEGGEQVEILTSFFRNFLKFLFYFAPILLYHIADCALFLYAIPLYFILRCSKISLLCDWILGCSVVYRKK